MDDRKGNNKRSSSRSIREAVKKKVVENPSGISFTDLTKIEIESKEHLLSPDTLSRHLAKLTAEGEIFKDPSTGNYKPLEPPYNETILSISLDTLTKYLEENKNMPIEPVKYALKEIIVGKYTRYISDEGLLTLIRVLENSFTSRSIFEKERLNVAIQIEGTIKSRMDSIKGKVELGRLLSRLEISLFDSLKETQFSGSGQYINISTWKSLVNSLVLINSESVKDVFVRIIELNLKDYSELISILSQLLSDPMMGFGARSLYKLIPKIYAEELKSVKENEKKTSFLNEIRNRLILMFEQTGQNRRQIDVVTKRRK